MKRLSDQKEPINQNLVVDCGDLLNVFLSASIYNIFSVLNYNKKADFLYRSCIFRCASS